VKTPAPTAERALLVVLVLVALGLAFVAWPDAGHDAGALEAVLAPGPSGSREARPLAEAGRRESTPGLATGAAALSAGRIDLGPEALPAPLVRAGEGVLLSGFVFERDSDRALAEALLALRTDTWSLEARTDAAGRFELELPRGSAPSLHLRCRGYADLRRPSLAVDQELRLELDPAGLVRGRVAGPAAGEFRAAEAFLWDLGSAQPLGESESRAPLDREGSFEFVDLAPGEYELCVVVPGWSLAFEHALHVTRAETTEVLLRPVRGAVLRGRLTLVDSDEPVVGAELRARPEVSGMPRAVEERGVLVTSSDAEGRYELAGLSMGKVVVDVEARWGTRERAELFVLEPGEELERDFSLEAPGSVAGHVLSESGQGVGFATVQVTWEAQPYATEPETPLAQDSGRLRTGCDANGRFRFEGLPAGRSLRFVAFRDPREDTPALAAERASAVVLLRLRSAEEREDFDLRLFETRSVRGVVRDTRGGAVAEAELSLWRAAARKSKEWLELQQARSGASGEFELGGLIPGRYRLGCLHPEHLAEQVTFDVPVPPGTLAPLEIELSPAGSIFGWVVDQHGDAIERATVRSKPLQIEGTSGVPKYEESARTDVFGRFEFPRLWPGTWSLAARAAGYETPPSPLTVLTRSTAPAVLELKESELRERTTVIGRVRGPGGDTPRKLHLDDLRGGALELRGDAFRLTGARSGSARLRFSAPGYLSLSTSRLLLPPGGELDLGWLELKPAGELRAFVRGPGDQPITKFKARLEPLTGSAKAKQKAGLILKLAKLRHTYPGTEQRASTRAAVHHEVPLKAWRLRIEAAGWAPFEQVLHFTPEEPRLELDVQLARP
jgi:protocatechuate 3,4-dioxygenase beta subunit